LARQTVRKRSEALWPQLEIAIDSALVDGANIAAYVISIMVVAAHVFAAQAPAHEES
jgi:hypothetical protein